MKVPCRGCEERVIGCHSSCEKYLKFAKWREEVRQEQGKVRASYGDYREFKNYAFRRNVSKSNKK